MTGRDLAAERTRAGLLQRHVAAAAGVTRPRIGQVERMRNPGPEWVMRYLAALEAVPPLPCPYCHGTGTVQRGLRAPQATLRAGLA